MTAIGGCAPEGRGVPDHDGGVAAGGPPGVHDGGTSAAGRRRAAGGAEWWGMRAIHAESADYGGRADRGAAHQGRREQSGSPMIRHGIVGVFKPRRCAPRSPPRRTRRCRIYRRRCAAPRRCRVGGESPMSHREAGVCASVLDLGRAARYDGRPQRTELVADALAITRTTAAVTPAGSSSTAITAPIHLERVPATHRSLEMSVGRSHRVCSISRRRVVLVIAQTRTAATGSRRHARRRSSLDQQLQPPRSTRASATGPSPGNSNTVNTETTSRKSPRDVMISMEHHFANMDLERVLALRDRAVGNDDLATLPTRPPVSDDPTERFRTFVRETQYTGVVNLTQVLHHLDTAWQRRHDPNIVLCHYADFSSDLAGEIARRARRTPDEHDPRSRAGPRHGSEPGPDARPCG